MQFVFILLSIAILAGIGLAIFFWVVIRSERNAANSCMLCHQKLPDSGGQPCARCGLIVCVECREKNDACPNCRTGWTHTAQGAANLKS
jgi:hypothetical protein